MRRFLRSILLLSVIFSLLGVVPPVQTRAASPIASGKWTGYFSRDMVITNAISGVKIQANANAKGDLTLQVDEEGHLTPTVSEAGNVSRGVPLQIPNLYETHNVVGEARFDIACLQVSPEGEVMEPMQPGQAVNFYWSVKPTDVGTYQGTIWLHLHFIPLQSGPDSRIALTAQPVEIKAINFLGLGGAPARILGGIGALLGSVLGLDNVISWVWGLLKKRTAARATRLKGDE